MYKAPPPEICSEQFYETDETRGFARGFSIQTVGPLPIGWAEHVLADGHWGQALREYMRDYNHWFTLGTLCELLPLPENRVTLAPSENDRHGIPVARIDYTSATTTARTSPSRSRRCTTSGRPAGAQDVLTIDRYAHLVGGCRMGSPRAAASSTPTTACWELPNLFIADGSVMPTQGSANPALTIMALASRLAERLDLKRAGASAEQQRRRLRRRQPRQPRREPVPAEPGLLAARVRLVVEDPVRALVVVGVDGLEQVRAPRRRRTAPRSAGR